jgi:hypothetical protein
MKELITALALAALTASRMLAAAQRWPSVEQLNRDDIYPSDSQWHQSYPNPDRELYVSQRGD